MEETFPNYQTALASLPEERSPFTLPAVKGRFYKTDDMDSEAVADPPANTTGTQLAAYPPFMRKTGATPLT